MKTSDTALLFIMKLVISFTIAILNTLIDYEFPLTHWSLTRTALSLVGCPSLEELVYDCHSSFYSL